MMPLMNIARSSIGAKLIMAGTGMALCLFVLVHMLGNLQIFLGQAAYNGYAHFLQSKPGLVWTARLGLLVMVLLHLLSGLRLRILNQRARPVGYKAKIYKRATFQSRSMVLSGLLVLSFIVYHLLHFTVGTFHPELSAQVDALGQRDVYHLFIFSFQNPWIATSYILAMILLALHLSHGVSSMLLTLGLYHDRLYGLIPWIGPAFAAVILLGNISMPFAVFFGLLLPVGGP